MTCQHEADVAVGERLAIFSKVGCRQCGAYLGTVVPKTYGEAIEDIPGDRAEWERSRKNERNPT